MAAEIILPRELPPAESVYADSSTIIDDGVTVRKATPQQIVDAAIIEAVNVIMPDGVTTVQEAIGNASTPQAEAAAARAKSEADRAVAAADGIDVDATAVAADRDASAVSANRAQVSANAAMDAIQTDYRRTTVASLPTAAQGATTDQTAFVTGTGRFYHFNGTSWVDDGPGVYATKADQTALTAETNGRIEQLRLNGEVRLRNLTGTGDALVGDLPPGVPNSVVNDGRMYFVPLVTNSSSAFSTLTIRDSTGVEIITRQLCDTNGNAISAATLQLRRRHIFERFSNMKWQIPYILPTFSDVPRQSTITGIQQDIAALETIRSAIPMNATQEAYGSTVFLTPVDAGWPSSGDGYEFAFIVPPNGGKAENAGISVNQGGRTRTLAKTRSEWRPSDYIIIKQNSQNSAETVRVGLSDDRLYETDQAVKKAPQIAIQDTADVPDRPETANSAFFYGWTDPTSKMRPGDVWLQRQQPAVPEAPSVRNFYIRPTLNSLAADIVLRGLQPNYPIPKISGYQYVVGNNSPMALPAESPSSAPIVADFVAGQEAFIQLAANNLTGTGAYSPIKYYTPRNSATFSHPLTPRAPATTEAMQGTYGFSNLGRTGDILEMTAQGVAPDPNSTGYARTDVNGLSGARLYGQVEITTAGTLTNEAPAIILGVNNPWDVEANTTETTSFPNGLFFTVRHTTWTVTRRLNSSTVTIESGTCPVAVNARIERVDGVLRGYVNDTQVTTNIDISALDPAYFNTARGIMIGVFRPSGQTTPYLRARNFTAGVIA